jgi:hypothetical protein
MRLLSTPLERDEGEFAYMGQLLLKGSYPYQESYCLKFPGTSFMYALFMSIFGETINGIHLGLLLTNVTSIILLFILVKRWFYSTTEAVIAASVFAITSLNPSVYGFAAHATHFIVLFTLIGLNLFYISINKNKFIYILLSGIMFSLALLMKQQAIFLVLFAISLILLQYLSKTYDIKYFLRFLLYFSIGFLLPIIILAAILIKGGTFNRFWFWTIQYAPLKGSLISLNAGYLVFMGSFTRIISESYLLWILTLVGLIIVLWNIRKKKELTILLFLIFSFSSIIPGYCFRPHYFILLLPVVGILAAVTFKFLHEKLHLTKKNRYLPLIVFYIIFIYTIIINYSYYFQNTLYTIERNAYVLDPFPESIKIAEFIKLHTTPEDRIQIFGSEPQIYFYSNRKSASGYVQMYPLTEIQEYKEIMKKEFCNDIERVKPKIIVFHPISGSWSDASEADFSIIYWADQYLQQNYYLVGIVDLVNENDIRFKWLEEIYSYKKTSDNIIYIFNRK